MTSSSATKVVEAFFDAYRAQDVEAMLSTCSDNADFHYVPIDSLGARRDMREGKVREAGKQLWSGLIACVPDLTNRVLSIRGDEIGNVSAEVTIGGTRSSLRGVSVGRRERFSVPHTFLFRVNAAGLIDMISAYCDSAELYQQLRSNALD